MNELQITARFNIHEGKLDEFKTVAKECFSLVKQEGGEPYQYDWFISEQHMECVIREQYSNSDALLRHLAIINDVFARLMSLGKFSAEICGDPSDELTNGIAGLDVKVYSFFQSLSKQP